ncbi:MAG: xylulose kinase, partial [Chloroflexi bacterium]
PDLFDRTACFLDVGGYLLYRATGRLLFEWTAASVTGLFNLKTKRWDGLLMRYFGLPQEKFPPLVRSTEQVGGLTAEAAADCGLLEGTPVVAGAGDVPTAAIGSGAIGEGEGHLYLGTSGWVVVMTGRRVTGKRGIASIQSADPDKLILIAETETAGACLQWIANQFYREEQADPAVENVFALMDQAVEQVEAGSGYLIFTPWMYGERSPVADVYLRSAFINLSYDHTREQMLRAVYEGVAYNLRWMVELIHDLYGFPLSVLRVIGGGARGAPWMQIIADVTGRRVEAVAHPQEAGAVGAALIAALGLGHYPNFDALKEVVHVTRVFEPRSEHADVYDTLFTAYKQVYRSLRGLYHRINRERFAAESPGP